MMGSRGTGAVLEVPFGADAITDFLTILRLLQDPKRTETALKQLAEARDAADAAKSVLDTRSAELDAREQSIVAGQDDLATMLSTAQSEANSIAQAKSAWAKELADARQSLTAELDAARKQHTDRLTRERTAWANERTAADKQFAEALAQLKTDQTQVNETKRALSDERQIISNVSGANIRREQELNTREIELNNLATRTNALRAEYEEKLAKLKALAA